MSKIKVVIVDDIYNTRAALRQLLEENNFDILADFEDGVEALQFIRENKVDLVLLDYNINTSKDGKNYTGIDLLQDIKAFNKTIKVIFISAHGEISIIKNAIIHGASDFIVKPFNLTDVIQRINKIFK